ncbi:MAG: DUF4124 domain-containing protein [Pseudomonadales bacterium]
MSQLVRALLVSGFISIFITPLSYAEDIYKRVDEKGVPSFSDAKTEGAEIITVEPVNVQAIPTPPPASYKPISPEASFSYNKLAIINPADQSTLRDEHNIVIQVTIEPGLRAGHQLEFLDNGQPLQTAGKNLSIELTNFDRGSHTLTARIIDKTSKVLKTSKPVTVHIFRTIAPPPAAPAP